MTAQDKYSLNKALETFFIESRELLDTMEMSLLQIEKGDFDDETINSIFRAIHTIKGSSGMFGLNNIESFTHVLENILDEARNNTIQIDEELISILFDSNDHIGHMLDEIESNEDDTLSKERQDKSKELITRLESYSNKTDEKTLNNKESETDVSESDSFISDTLSEENYKVLSNCWHISVRFQKDCFKNSLDPVSILNYLRSFGEIVEIEVIKDSLPSLEELNPEECYLGFEINYNSDSDKKKIEESFEFFNDDCTFHILPPNSSIVEYVRLINELPEQSYFLGEILCKVNSLTEKELDQAIDLQIAQNLNLEGEDTKKQIGEIMVENQMIQKPIIEAALKKQVKSKKTNTIRIDADKLDKLINLVGELVISGATIKQFGEKGEVDNNFVKKSYSIMSRLIEDIRDNTMNMRMVQIGETFRRFERIVRDISKEQNKEIELIINGGDTELDRNLIEKITDPLLHLIRNAVDHGIDNPDEREERGKPRKGIINLNAYNEAGNIIIEVIDDGNGLRKDKIFDKAVKAGIIQEDAEISDHELFQFIFEAGFSTAEKVTNISGRGVGMDVVKRNIENLRGLIILDSKEGEGTKVKIQLPLTLAIIDGFMVKVNDSYYIVPLNLVLECTEVTSAMLNEKDGCNYIDLRGEFLPFMKLRSFFGEESEEPELQDMIVVDYKGTKAGIVVDELVGEFQTVIKPLGEIFKKLSWVSGGTILGNGDVAVILDVPKLLQNLEEDELIQAV